ncbi:MAG: hypothetical protein IJD28_00850 [Deferribacterales bacterium]|nr:hypothetical protein [Deferribacterales bacterium]
MSESGLSDQDKKDIAKALSIAVASTAVTGIVSAVTAKAVELLATNIHKKTLTGNKVLSATQDETVLSNKETNATNIKSSLANDEVAAQNGSVKASETAAAASTADATASEAGAVASRAKAGASDIETKALKMT